MWRAMALQVYKRNIMRENLEVIFLASLFFVSVLAIAPVS